MSVLFLNKEINLYSFFNKNYFAKGQIAVIRNDFYFVVGGSATILNYDGQPNMISADVPIFKYIYPNVPIRINRPAVTNTTVIDKIDDYTVRISTNITLAANGEPVFISVNFGTGGTEITLYNYIENLQTDVFVNDAANMLTSPISQYDVGFYTFANTNAFGNIPIVGNVVSGILHKNIDSNIIPYLHGYTYTEINYANLTAGSGPKAIRFDFGASFDDVSLFASKISLSLPFTSKPCFFHLNPLYFSNTNQTNNPHYLNITNRFQQTAFNSNNEITDVNSIALYQFGDFGERGDGQLPNYVPKNIVVNSGSGFALTTAPQTLQFELPLEAQTYNPLVYIVFQRYDTDTLNLNNGYQTEFGTTVCFAKPVSPTIPANLGLSNEVLTCYSLAVVPVGGGNYRYDWSFNISPANLTRIQSWSKFICYVVIETTTATESHVLFEFNNTQVTPINQIQLVDNTQYDGIKSVVLPDNYAICPYFTFRCKFQFDLTQIQNANFLSIKGIVQDKQTGNVILQEYPVNSQIFYANGYPNLQYRSNQQNGTYTNNKVTFFEFKSNGTNIIDVYVPVQNRHEFWIELTPNDGLYYNSGYPFNGFNHEFYLYNTAVAIVEFVYELNGTIYTERFNFSNDLTFLDVNVSTDGVPLDTSLITILDDTFTPVTELYENNTYYLELNRSLYMSSEDTHFIKMLFEYIDNPETCANYYPSDSYYRTAHLMNYQSIILNEVTPDRFEFKLPQGKVGKLDICIGLSKFMVSDYNQMTKLYNYIVKKQPEQTTTDFFIVDNTTCCVSKLVYYKDKATIISDKNNTINVLKDGNIVAMITDNTYGKFHNYGLIEGLQIFECNFELLYNDFGAGDYTFIVGVEQIAPIYCVETDLSLFNGTITFETVISKPINNLDFANNPTNFFIRLDGFISKVSYTTERDEIILSSGKVLPADLKGSKSLSFTIKKALLYDLEQFKYMMLANYLTVVQYNQNNPINFNDISILPPSSIEPNFNFGNNYAYFTFDAKVNNVLNSNKC